MDLRSAEKMRALRIARGVSRTVKGGYLEELGEPVSLRGAYLPDLRYFCRIGGFRLTGDEVSAERLWNRAAASWFGCTGARSVTSAYILAKDRDGLRVYYGAEQRIAENPFSGIPECSATEEAWNVRRPFSFTGIVTGTLAGRHLADLYASSPVQDGYIASVIFPVSDAEIQSRINADRQLESFLAQYRSVRHVYGTQTQRVEETPVPEIEEAIVLLKEERETMEASQEGGYVRTCIRFGAMTEEDFRSTASILISAVHASDYGRNQERRGEFQPVRMIVAAGECRDAAECLAIPCVDTRGGEGGMQPERTYTFTLQPAKGPASLCVPPLRSVPGFYVRNYNVTEESQEIFPLTAPIAGDAVRIGSVIEQQGTDSLIPLSAINAHMFVAGASSSGKTTTVKALLKQLQDRGIPFLVLEAAKKEYAELIDLVPGLRVYTPGHDGLPLTFNPMEPEEGTLIENHAEALTLALTGSMGGEEPIPTAMEGLIRMTYSRHGWEYGMLAYHDPSRPFPTLREALDMVPEYIRNHAQYGPEVRQNLTAALTLRTESAAQGALGRMMATEGGVTARELLSGPAVIELADLSSGAVSFLLNILLFRIQRYLARQAPSHTLNRVIVVEEAHNIFRRTLEEGSARARNNEYLEKMLAEVRASGAGIVMIDQRPSVMSEAVLANTAVKVIHALPAYEDRELVGKSAGMNETQVRRILEFSQGECAVSVSGIHGIQHTRVDGRVITEHANPKRNPACIMCGCRFRCRRQAILGMINGMNRQLLDYYAARITSSPYDAQALKIHIAEMLRDLHVGYADTATKLCLFGEILAHFGTISVEEKRVILRSYQKILISS